MTETLGPDGPGVHPVAAVFPLMEGSDLHDLIEDVRAHGLREPIWLTPDGLVLDGRNRWRACQVANVEPRYRTYEGDDLIEFVVSLNLKRRHLDESQRQVVASKIANLPRGRPSNPDKTADLQFFPSPPRTTVAAAAKLMNVSERGVHNARKVLRDGSDNVVRAVESGEVSVDAAYHAVRAAQQKAGGVEEAKKVQAAWSPDDIKAAAKKAREQEIVRSAQEAEAAGEGNAVTEFMIREKRIPSPPEAHVIAQRTGLGVVDSRGMIQPPVSLDRIETRAVLDERWGAFADALEAVARHTAEELVEAIPSYQRESVVRRLPGVIERLNRMRNLLDGVSDHGKSIQSLA